MFQILCFKHQTLINSAQFCSKVLAFIILIKQRVPFNYCVVLIRTCQRFE